MINKKLFPFLVSAFAACILFLASCEDNVYRINSKKLLREEQELLDEYLELNGEELENNAIEKVDTFSNGLIIFKMKKGDGDTVKVGKTVAYRYSLYNLTRDEETEKPKLILAGSNEEGLEPSEYKVGVVYPKSNVYGGLDQAIRFMKKGEKVKLILPSLLWSNDYVTRVMDLEITYVER